MIVEGVPRGPAKSTCQPTGGSEPGDLKSMGNDEATLAPMSGSEVVTTGIRVRVEAEYSEEHSRPQLNQWFFLYTITVSNESNRVVQLMTRHWIITDATQQIEEVRGPGVVGEQPVLRPGESFKYTSGCPLPTPFGAMEGSYQMVDEAGDPFDVAIERFLLMEPNSIN